MKVFISETPLKEYNDKVFNHLVTKFSKEDPNNL